MTLRRQANTDVIEDLARRTAAPVALIKDLYDDEVTKLRAKESLNYLPHLMQNRSREGLS